MNALGPKDPAQQHVDTIFTAMQYVAARCPQQYDHDMELRFREILKSFDRYRGGKALVYPDPSDAFFDDTLGRNYLVLQCGALLAFANSVQALALQAGSGKLQGVVERLWAELEAAYRKFFGEPPAPEQ